MKQRIALFGSLALFWMTFFSAGRLAFLFYNRDLTNGLGWIDLLTALVLGLRMDAAMAGYWMILSGLLLTASVFNTGAWVRKAHLVIVIVLLVVSVIIITGDLELYRNWGFRMDTTPLMYAGSEGAASIQPWVLAKLLTFFIAFAAVALFTYLRWIAPRFDRLERHSGKGALTMFLLTAALFLPIRSSFSVAPLNTGVVYFHKTIAFANHLGINVVWNFFKSLTRSNRFRYPTNLMDQAEARQLVDSVRDHGNPLHKKVISTTRPNILLIILESFTAKVIEPLGGAPGVTPSLNRLSKEGILFTQFYASGDRTDKGLVSILSGYPAQPKTSIIKFPQKTQSLPYLPKALENLGYHTSFVYGGDIGFANMESYITTAGFAHVTEDDDFDSELDNSKWGVHDHLMFERLLVECDTASGPFFKTVLTLSSHEPFDVPLDPPFLSGKDEASLFLNACYYTDKSLGEFIAKAKERSWWTNTWVIITADHGHRYPNSEELKEKERFRIPMLWLGGAITAADSTVHTVASQTDIANTVLAQVDAPLPAFTFSKNAVGRSHSFAVYLFHNGYGYLSDQEEYIYDFDLGNFLKKPHNKTDLRWGQAYVQTLFYDYNNR